MKHTTRMVIAPTPPANSLQPASGASTRTVEITSANASQEEVSALHNDLTKLNDVHADIAGKSPASGGETPYDVTTSVLVDDKPVPGIGTIHRSLSHRGVMAMVDSGIAVIGAHHKKHLGR